MGLAERVLERAEALRSQNDPVTLEEFGYLLGRGNGNSVRTRAGVTIGPRRALGLPAWYRGVSYLTNGVAGLPVHSYRTLPGDQRQKRADPSWFSRPDIETPWFALVEHWMMSLLHKGNAYAFKLRDTRGVVTGLRPLHPDRVVPGHAADGTKMFMLDGNYEKGYTRREILHIPGLGYDGCVGLNPLQFHAESLGLAVAADEYAARSFGQGTHLRAYITLPQTLKKEDAERLKAEWETFHSGMSNAHSFGVLGNGADYKTVSLDPQQAQLLQTREFGVTEMSRILGVPPHKLFDLTHATFSNIENQSIEAATDSIRPWLVRIEAYVNFDQDLFPGATPTLNFLEFEIEGLMRGDMASMYDAWAKAVGGPWMTANEPRRLKNMAPVSGGDELLAPLAMHPAGEDGSVKDKLKGVAELVAAGYDPAESLAALGLPAIAHTGKFPGLVQPIVEKPEPQGA